MCSAASWRSISARSWASRSSSTTCPAAAAWSARFKVSQAAPDGYQFVLGSIGTHALNQTLSKKPLYDAATDFAHGR